MGMGMFVLGIVVLLGTIVLLVTKFRKWSPLSLLVAVVLLAMSCFSTVPTGVTGIPVTFGKVGTNTLEAGFHLVLPFTKVVKMDNREQRRSFSLQAFSSDMQEVLVEGSVNYRIDKNVAVDLYKTVGVGYANILLDPRIMEDAKIVFSKYSAEALMSNRAVLSNAVEQLLIEDVTGKGIVIVSVSISNLDFSDAFTNAIEEKQVATQRKLRAQTEQDQLTMEEQAAAERMRIAAQAEADVVRIHAEAEAEANTTIAASITSPLIQYSYVQNWDGKLPHVMGANDNFILDISSSVSEEE